MKLQSQCLFKLYFMCVPGDAPLRFYTLYCWILDVLEAQFGVELGPIQSNLNQHRALAVERGCWDTHDLGDTPTTKTKVFKLVCFITIMEHFYYCIFEWLYKICFHHFHTRCVKRWVHVVFLFVTFKNHSPNCPNKKTYLNMFYLHTYIFLSNIYILA